MSETACKKTSSVKTFGEEKNSRSRKRILSGRESLQSATQPNSYREVVQ